MSWGNFSSWVTRLACREGIFLREGQDLLVVRKFFFVRDRLCLSWGKFSSWGTLKRFLGFFDFSSRLENGIFLDCLTSLQDSKTALSIIIINRTFAPWLSEGVGGEGANYNYQLFEEQKRILIIDLNSIIISTMLIHKMRWSFSSDRWTESLYLLLLLQGL